MVTQLIAGAIGLTIGTVFGVGLGVYMERRSRYKAMWRAQTTLRECAEGKDMSKFLQIYEKELTRTDEYRARKN